MGDTEDIKTDDMPEEFDLTPDDAEADVHAVPQIDEEELAEPTATEEESPLVEEAEAPQEDEDVANEPEEDTPTEDIPEEFDLTPDSADSESDEANEEPPADEEVAEEEEEAETEAAEEEAEAETDEEADDEEEAEEEEEEESKADVSKPVKEKKYLYIKGRKIPLNIVIIVIGVFITLLVSVPLYFWIISDSAIVNISERSVDDSDDADDGDTPEETASYKKQYFYDIDLFKVPIKNDLFQSTGNPHFQIQMSFEVESEDILTELEGKVPILRDVIMSLISGRKISEVNSTLGKLKLKNDIRKHVNAFLEEGGVLEVYFTDFRYTL